MTAIVSPEGRHLAPPLTEGEGMLIADLDLSLIVKRKRMMDSVGHYARPELVSVTLDPRPARPLHFAPVGARRPNPDPCRRRLSLNLSTARLINELQTYGVRLVDPKAGRRKPPRRRRALRPQGADDRRHDRNGAGPHRARRSKAPMSSRSPTLTAAAASCATAKRSPRCAFPQRPRFYDLTTADGVPYSKIATLHGRDVLATTVLQTCIRYQSRTKTCQFCAIGQSLAAGRTIERKTPAQLAEVAKAAVELDGVKHMVMTTGTPRGRDRGAAMLAESATAVKNAVYLPIQAQCEPPDDDEWFARMKSAGVDSLGMHVEVVTPELRRRLMPGKSEMPVERYLAAFAAATPVFGRGQVSTYILAGLGDSAETILELCTQTRRARRLSVRRAVRADLRHAARKPSAPRAPPSCTRCSQPLSRMLVEAGLTAADIKAGCGKCGACSSLATYERSLAS